ncbi:hypothetical protein AB0J42_35820 [Nonomuraea sp. NPDC049649]|uniref:hypothetical protein n=1 Tax=Nonomuraea sp. NPDC049649 TaxID=3155776 RepID=UPI00343647EE
MYDHWTEIVNPWTCASRFFRPDGADTTRPFQRLSDWRARIGAFFIIYLSIPATGWADLVWNFIGKGSLSLFVGAFVALTAVLRSAPASCRRCRSRSGGFSAGGSSSSRSR